VFKFKVAMALVRIPLLCLLFICTALAQPNCPLPPAIQPVAAASDIFSETQESDLGDVMAEQLAPNLAPIKDEGLDAHLRDIGQQLTKYLPPTQLRFQFILIELPEVNAFSLPGGRVYVARKLVAIAHNDDELAGILAHELGHIVTHQGAMEMTLAFRQVLGVTQVGDISDIRDKYVRYLDNYRRKPVRFSSEEGHQYEADQVAVFAMARAGFAPHAYADIWDRFQDTHGHTGNWISDLFGTTKPSEKRLREILKNLAVLPKDCAEMRPTSDVTAFQKWQAAVVAYRLTTLKESLPGLISRQQLALPLRPDITNVKFSPDGKHILAQDDGGIHVLTREPLAPIFFIDAPNAEKAAFSSDSSSIVFHTRSLRVEAWDLATKDRASATEMVVREPCIQSTLSPDGKFLACVRSDWSLTVLDVASSTPLFIRDHFVTFYRYTDWLHVFTFMVEGKFEPVAMAFSPDSHYFLAGTLNGTFDYDLHEKHEVSLPNSIKKITRSSFAFLGNDRIVGVDHDSAQKSPVLRFPTGERIAELPLGNTTHVTGPAHGDNVLLWPLKEKPLGVMDIHTGQFIASFEHNAGDVFDDVLVGERVDGEIAVFDIGKKRIVGTVRLNQSRLGHLRTVTVSPSFDLLAVSTPSRGAVWDLTHNIRLALSYSFSGAWLTDEHLAYIDFAKHEKLERTIGRVDAMGNIQTVLALEELSGFMTGPYFVAEKRAHESGYERKDWTFEIQDYRNKSIVWSRRFPHEVPSLSLHSSGILLEWPANADAAKEEMQKFPDLKGRPEKDDIFLELIDMKKDAVVGKQLVHTNKASFRILQTALDGDWIAFATSGDRVLVYSLSSGEEKMRMFGGNPIIHAASHQMAVSTAAGELDLYELANSSVKRQYNFPTSVMYAQFSPDGRRLFVLTRDQTAYTLDLTVPQSAD
jgi:WD40 repeat protein